MSVTIDEIAHKAKVSRSTVSRALSNSPLISAETKERVQQVAAELGYVPNYVAQSLSVMRTNTIGMVITHPSSPFDWHVLEGVELAAHKLGISVLLSTARNSREREIEVIQSFQRRRVDGIILTSSHTKQTYNMQSQQIEIPVILINDPQPEGKFKSVTIDDYAGAQLAVTYLASIGHQRIGYVGCLDRPESNERRYAGYTDTMQSRSLASLPEFKAAGLPQSDFETGYGAAEHVIGSGITAVFCYNDRIALGLLANLHKRGIAVPKEMSVVGFDDIEEASYTVPSLTTIRQPMLKLGYIAVEMLLNVLSEESVTNQTLDCELIIRDSTQSFLP